MTHLDQLAGIKWTAWLKYSVHQSSLHCHMRCLYLCRCPPLLPKVQIILSLFSAVNWVECAIVAGQCCYIRVSALLSSFPAATRAASAIVAVICCHVRPPVLSVLCCAVLSLLASATTWVASFYCRWHLLQPELPVTIVARICCYLSCQWLLSLSFAATWVASYYCRWHLLLP